MRSIQGHKSADILLFFVASYIPADLHHMTQSIPAMWRHGLEGDWNSQSDSRNWVSNGLLGQASPEAYGLVRPCYWPNCIYYCFWLKVSVGTLTCARCLASSWAHLLDSLLTELTAFDHSNTNNTLCYRASNSSQTPLGDLWLRALKSDSQAKRQLSQVDFGS